MSTPTMICHSDMIATIEHTPDGPALLVHGVRVAEKPVGDTTLQALADQINAKAGWRPIETFPKGGTDLSCGTRIILFRMGHIVCGSWYDDRYAKNPRPYWTHDQERLWGTRDARLNPPSHWMSLPEPPV